MSGEILAAGDDMVRIVDVYSLFLLVLKKENRRRDTRCAPVGDLKRSAAVFVLGIGTSHPET
jgi:hypothetical protein